MTWLRAIHGATSRDKRVRLFYVIDKDLRPSRVLVATFRCAGTYRVFWNLRATRIVLPWRQFAGSFVFLRISVCLLFGGDLPPGCLSSSLIFIWKTEPSRPAEWNSVLLALKSVSKISPANIILIHVRPAEIYCWNCNMLAFFFFLSSILERLNSYFCKYHIYCFFFFFPIFSSAPWFAGTLQPCIPPKEKPQEVVDPSKSTVDCFPPPTPSHFDIEKAELRPQKTQRVSEFKTQQ